MLKDVLNNYHRSVRLIGPNVATHLFFVLISAGVLVPIIAGLVGLTLSFSGQSALTDQDIARFLITPAGIIGAGLVLTLAIVVIVLDVAVMTAVLRCGIRRPIAALRLGTGFFFGALLRVIQFAAHLLGRVLILTLPFVVVSGAIAFLMLREYDINFYLSTRPPEFLVAVSLIAVTLLIGALLLISRLVGWSTAMHLMLFDGISAGEAFQLSETSTRPHRWKIFKRLTLWLAIRVAIGVTVAAIVAALLTLTPSILGNQLILVAGILTLIVVLAGIVNLVLSAVVNGALADLLNDEFERILEGRSPANDIASADPVGTSAGLGIGLPLIFSVVATVSVTTGVVLLEQISPGSKVEVIGHRGAAASRPENTMAAVTKAIEDGANWVEIDVQESADGQVIVVHDSDFMKAAGVPTKVWEVTYDELGEIDIGSWFDPAYSNERTPLLSDVLAAAKGRSKVIIELKYYGHDVDLENRVIGLVEDAGMADQIATMSLKYPAVQKMISLRPNWRTGVLAATAVGELSGLEGDFLAISQAQVSRRVLNSAHEAGKQVYAWTVNDTMGMSRMISLGVDGLITDEPALANEVIAWRKELSTSQRLLLWVSDTFGATFDLIIEEDLEP